MAKMLSTNDISLEKLDGLLLSSFYDGITYEKLRDSATGTDYWVTTIPHTDEDGNLIALKHGFQNDVINSGDGETPRDFAIRHVTSFCSNASTADTDGDGHIYGLQIQDGVIKQEDSAKTTVGYVLGIKADNTLKAYPAHSTGATLLADGVVNAVTAYFPIIENGVMVDTSIWNPIGNSIVRNPRQIIAQMPNKDIKFFTFEGRSAEDAGVTLQEAVTVILTHGVTFAYNLDGGGSAQPVVRGTLLTVCDSDGGTDERKTWDFLYVKREIQSAQNVSVLTKDIGEANKRALDVERQLVEVANPSTTDVPFTTVTDFNTVTVGVAKWNTFYGVNGSIANAPDTGSWLVRHYQIGSLSAIQEAIPYSSSGAVTSKRRIRDSGGTWSSWV